MSELTHEHLCPCASRSDCRIWRVAKTMYEAPYNNESGSVWPPRHPDDRAWWMTRAQAAVGAMT